MTVPQETDDWRKPSVSQDEGACFEVKRDLSALRDSKNPTGPQLQFSVAAFVAAVKTDQITR